MYFLPIALIIVSTLSLIITFFSIKIKKNAIETVNDMGIGWNLGSTFESRGDPEKIKTPDDQITLDGNPIPTKKMISRMKKYGFKTIRFPVTWYHFMDDKGNVNPEWMSRVKEVVTWIIKEKMYCILNVHHDGEAGKWLRKGLEVKDRYIYLWKQISNEFKNFNEYLIFESMNDVTYTTIEGKFDYIVLLTLTQSFVDVVRNSGGKNSDRLLLISGAEKDIQLTCTSEYKLPIDPSNKLAVTLVYNLPKQFAIEPEDNPWTYIGENGVINIVPTQTVWGDENDYKDMFTQFETMKEVYTSKGIPVVIVEVHVITEQKKEKASIRRYLFTEFSMSNSYEGIMSCLWDTSGHGSMNHYNRETDKWYDEGIKDNFIKISEGKEIKPRDFFVFTNTETVRTPNIENHMRIYIGVKKVLKVIFNAMISTKNLTEVSFSVVTNNITSQRAEISVPAKNGERKYDGSYSFTVDVSHNDNNDFMQIEKGSGKEYITFNYFTCEFAQSHTFFDYNEYIKVIS